MSNDTLDTLAIERQARQSAAELQERNERQRLQQAAIALSFSMHRQYLEAATRQMLINALAGGGRAG